MLTAAKVLTGVVYAVILSFVVILTTAFVLQLFGANPTADSATRCTRRRPDSTDRSVGSSHEAHHRPMSTARSCTTIIVYSASASRCTRSSRRRRPAGGAATAAGSKRYGASSSPSQPAV